MERPETLSLFSQNRLQQLPTKLQGSGDQARPQMTLLKGHILQTLLETE